MAELFFWPALLCYGEAALGYLGEARQPGLAGRAALWGVRFGWLAQTALLVVQAAREDGFPWSTWAGSLNLFVWFVVTVYLFWGSRRPYRLLGLAVMPLVAVLLLVRRAAPRWIPVLILVAIPIELAGPMLWKARLFFVLLLAAFLGLARAVWLLGPAAWAVRDTRPAHPAAPVPVGA